jgi:hypothetical protein
MRLTSRDCKRPTPPESQLHTHMELPIGFDAPEGEHRKSYVLRLNESLYGLKQAGQN